MTGETREDTLLASMRALNPVSAAELRREISDEELRHAMDRAVAVAESTPRSSSFRFGPPRAARLALGAGLACLTALAALVLVAGLPGGGGSGPAFAAAAIRIAEANPRLLVTEAGWSVTRADQFEAESGEVTFSDGEHDLDMVWYPARFYRGYLRDRARVSAPAHSTLLGRAATTVGYGRGEYATMLAPEGPVFVEVRGRLGGRDAYESVLRSLRPVDVESWLAAMPASVVTPGARPAAVRKALQGIPLPPGFDTAALEDEDAVRDRYGLAVEVTGAVACGWVESWLAARRAGDAEAVAAAVDAMSTWNRWPVLRGSEMRRGFALNVRRAASLIEHDRLDRGAAGIVVHPDGRSFAYGPAWSLALGCEPRWRRRR